LIGTTYHTKLIRGGGAGPIDPVVAGKEQTSCLLRCPHPLAEPTIGPPVGMKATLQRTPEKSRAQAQERTPEVEEEHKQSFEAMINNLYL